MSIFTYGCEAKTLTEVLKTKIDSFDMWCLCRMGKVSWKDKATNNKVLQKLGTERKLKIGEAETTKILRAHQETEWLLDPHFRGKET